MAKIKHKDLPHVKKAKRLLKEKGLAGQDWSAAKFFEPENKPHAIASYQGGAKYYFALCYDKEGNWMFEDKIAFENKAMVIKFAHLLGAKLSFD